MGLEEFESAVPTWTVQDDKQGLDPLGMQNTSISLYQHLLPGVSNVTLRMRYYGLHAWLIAEYARRRHDPDPDDWCIFLRRAEALYALISQFNTQDAGVAGNRWATRKLQEVKGERVRFAASTDRGAQSQYLRQKFGAFGAAYSSQMHVVGLIQPARDHEIPVPTEAGARLAKAFKQGIGTTGKLFLDVSERGSVELKELTRLSLMAPSFIDNDGLERQLYEDLLFARTAPDDTPAAQRRKTLRLVLHTAREINRSPFVSDVRWASYSGFNYDGKPLAPLPHADAEHRYKWRVYHANDLTHVCHESLLRFVLESLTQYPDGIDLKVLLNEVALKLLEVASPQPSSWAELEAAVSLTANAWCEEPTSEWTLSETLLGIGSGVAGAEVTFRALQLLAVLGKRFSAERVSVKKVLAPVAHASSHTILTEPQFLEVRKDAPIERTLVDLIKERVLDRHLVVALQKLRAGDYTFLFEVEDGRIRLRRHSGPVLTNPRLGSAIRFLNDINLLGDEGLTDAGARALEAV